MYFPERMESINECNNVASSVPSGETMEYKLCDKNQWWSFEKYSNHEFIRKYNDDTLERYRGS